MSLKLLCSIILSEERRNLGGYGEQYPFHEMDMVVMRHPNPGAGEFLSQHVDASIVNAGDGAHEHPTQALLDAFSIRERLGSLEGAKVAIVGDIVHSRVALSNVLLLKKMVLRLWFVGQQLGLQSTCTPWASAWSTTCKQPSSGVMLQTCCAYSTNVKTLNTSLPSPSRAQYGLTMEHLDALEKPIVVMHPGPINRGVEITSEVADSEHAIILDQVENGVAVRTKVVPPS